MVEFGFVMAQAFSYQPLTVSAQATPHLGFWGMEWHWNWVCFEYFAYMLSFHQCLVLFNTLALEMDI